MIEEHTSFWLTYCFELYDDYKNHLGTHKRCTCPLPQQPSKYFCIVKRSGAVPYQITRQISPFIGRNKQRKQIKMKIRKKNILSVFSPNVHRWYHLSSILGSVVSLLTFELGFEEPSELVLSWSVELVLNSPWAARSCSY